MSGKTTETSVYRCVPCGHGRDLMAWAPANVYGPLGADGELAGDTDVWTYGIHEDSIQCSKHPDAMIEMCAGGVWCRWWRCPWCDGDGKSCEAGFRPPGAIGRALSHEGWRPAAELGDLPALPGAGPGHVFIVKPGEPGRNACCHLCQVPAGSISGQAECPGDRHQCPASVPEGTPGAMQPYKHPGWFCDQPGEMGTALASWTCTAGHVTTRDNHEHPGGRCVIVQRCPWDDLTPAEAARAATA